VDPFATLGIDRSFDVDLGVVERTYRELARDHHPDRFIGASPSERRAALDKAVAVNAAWRVVRDPIHRAEALLRLGGVEVGESSGPKPDPTFLMEMLEQREALSDAKRARDLAAVRAMAAAIEARAQEATRSISEGFASGEGATLVAKVGELRFYRRFLDEVSAIEDELAA
jgi:molecular chaperone HscB